MTKWAKWPPCHSYVLRQKVMISTTFHREGLQIALPKFKVDKSNSVGGVC